MAAAQEESGCPGEDVDGSFAKASDCAQESGQARLQVRASQKMSALGGASEV